MDLAITHVNADLDGIASLVAVSLLEGPLELAVPGAMDPVSRRFWTTYAADLPPLVPPHVLIARLQAEPLGRLRLVDTADPARVGPLGAYVGRFADALAYDNHPSTPEDLPRAAMPDAGAVTSALVLALAGRGARPTAAQAGLFLLGIHADTGHFTFPNTTEADHRAAARCLGWGADPELPRAWLPRGYTRHQLALLRAMVDGLVRVQVGPREIPLLILDQPAYEPDLSDLLEDWRAAEGEPVAFALASQGRRVAVIGRSDGALSVGEVLRGLGGGGHPEAASAVLADATLLEAQALLELALRRAARAPVTAGEAAVRPYVSRPDTAPISEVADALFQHRINSLPLTTGEGADQRVVGLVTRQEVDAALRHRLGDRPAREISAGPPAVVPPQASLAEARRILREDGRRLILVGAPGEPPLGVLSRGTLFRAWEAETWDLPGSQDAVARPRLIQRLRGSLGRRFPLITAVGALAATRGVSAWLVGGPVRDVLLGRDVRDVDLVIEGDAVAFAQAAAAALGGTCHPHGAFGTATWRSPQGDIDFATARVEYYEAPATLPRVLHAGLRRDLYRRDFTINAMAVGITPDTLGELVDPFGGVRDLDQRLLRVLHGLSFHDDPTRAFRAARFAARFDLRLAPQTLALMRAAREAGVMAALGRERLGAELDRALQELEVVQVFRLLRDWELLPLIHAHLQGHAALLDRLAQVSAGVARWRGLRGDAPSPVRAADALWMVLAEAVPEVDRAGLVRLVPGDRHAQRRWREGPERVAQALGRAWSARRPADAGRALQDLDPVERAYALGVCRSARGERWLLWWEQEGAARRSAVRGEDLIAAGVAPGPALGRGLDAAQDAAWDGLDAAAQRQAALEAATQCGT